jgi:hypothetical protein
MSQRDRFVAAAQGELGKPYSAHRDCSGFTAWAARQADFLLPEGSVAQFKVGQSVPVRDIEKGDLVFWDTFGPSPGHVAIYDGEGGVLHALNPDRGIIRSDLHANMGGPMVGVRRVIGTEDASNPKDHDTGTGGIVTSVTPQSPFRELGNTDRQSFRAALARTVDPATTSPFTPAVADAIYDVLAPKGLTRLAAAMAWIERSNETNRDDLQYYGRDLHNAWAVKNSDGSWAKYPDYAAAASAWADRILGPVYADLTTVADFIGRYAPWSDGNNPINYGRKVAAQVNALPRQVIITPTPHPDPTPTPTPGPTPADPWRPYPFPPMERLICEKPYDGAGFDRVVPRGPRIVGSCNHITDGRGSIESYSAFFSTGGERATDALVDTVIGRDGRIGLLNDWRDNTSGGTRAGWANGTANDLEADGVAFYRRYPLINDVLVSKEHEGKAGEPLTKEQLTASIELSTAVAQSVKCPWDTYPYHPGLGGVNIELMHFWFARNRAPPSPSLARTTRG